MPDASLLARESWAHLTYTSVKKEELLCYGFEWIPFKKGSWKSVSSVLHLIIVWLVFLINSSPPPYLKGKYYRFLRHPKLTFSLTVELCTSSLALFIDVPEAMDISFLLQRQYTTA